MARATRLMPRHLPIELVQRDFDEQPPQVAAAFDRESPVASGDEEAAISRHHDVFGIDAAGQLDRQPAASQSREAFGIAGEDRVRGLAVAGLIPRQQVSRGISRVERFVGHGVQV